LGDRNAIFLLALILIASPVAAQRTAIKPIVDRAFYTPWRGIALPSLAISPHCFSYACVMRNVAGRGRSHKH
jgi:hypothetical protein